MKNNFIWVLLNFGPFKSFFVVLGKLFESSTKKTQVLNFCGVSEILFRPVEATWKDGKT